MRVKTVGLVMSTPTYKLSHPRASKTNCEPELEAPPPEPPQLRYKQDTDPPVGSTARGHHYVFLLTETYDLTGIYRFSEMILLCRYLLDCHKPHVSARVAPETIATVLPNTHFTSVQQSLLRLKIRNASSQCLRYTQT